MAELEEVLTSPEASTGNRSGTDIVALCRAVEAKRRAANRRATIQVWLLRVILIVVTLTAWQLVADWKLINPLLISKPTAVVLYLATAVQTAALWNDVASTFLAAVIGVMLGSLLGIAAAVVLSLVPILYRALNFFVTFFNTLPRPALAPLFLVWFGLGLGGKVAVSVSAVGFVLFYTTIAGISSIDRDLLMLADTLGMTTRQRLFYVLIPGAAPAIIAGLRLGTALGVLGAVVAEMVASYSGLGQLLVQTSNQFDIGGTFGVLLILGTIAVIIDIGMARLERHFRRS